MIRFFDFTIAFFALAAIVPFLAILVIIIFIFDGAPLFFQERVGLYKKRFYIVKLRTMYKGTPSSPTHAINANSVTYFGRFLRKYKLDELPQLWNVLRGEMSLVGPRPCLFNQEELIAERAARGVFEARPGVTGLAQIQGIDMSTPALLARTDAEMIESLSLRDYFRYIFLTVLGKGKGDRVRRD